MSPKNQELRVINVGIIGYGFMGQTHAKAYQNAQRDGYPCRVVAIADTSLKSIENIPSSGNIEPSERAIDYSGITLIPDAQGVIEHPDIDLVSICTHTDTHVEIAVKALNVDKHVLVEKPISIKPQEVERLASAARKSSCICIPAMCMRFWPAWMKVREIISSNQYGAVRSAVFHRLGSRPNWAAEFYADETRSGGALYDLHIHDTDFIVHCFGVPDSVTTSGDGLHLSTIYHYKDSPIHVLAHAAWDHQPSMGFQMQCTVVCEQATIDFDINRADQLMIYQGEDATPIDVGTLSGYDIEVRAIIDSVTKRSVSDRATMEDASLVAKILDLERQSMRQQSTISIDARI